MVPLLLLLAFALAGCGGNGPKTQEKMRIHALLIASRAYATDHEGKYPEVLADLHPKYIDLASGFYSPPVDSKGDRLQPFHYRQGHRVGSKVDEPLIISPKVIRGKVSVGYLGGFIRQVELEFAQDLLSAPGWVQDVPAIAGK